MIQKIKLNFTHSEYLGPFIFNKKIDVPVVTKLATSCLSSQHFNRLVIFSLSLSDITFCTFLPTLRTHRATQIFYQHFLKVILWHLTVLQNNFHGLSSSVVGLFSSQCVFLNLVLQLTACLRTLAIYPHSPHPPPPQKKNNNNSFCIFSCVIMSSTTKYNN